jgi:hypothetical protein
MSVDMLPFTSVAVRVREQPHDHEMRPFGNPPVSPFENMSNAERKRHEYAH